MVILLSELVKMSDKEIAARGSPHNLCTKCGKLLKINSYTLFDKIVCGNCYFSELGKIAEEHPVGLPHGHGPYGGILD